MDFSQVQSICQTSFKIHNVRIQGCHLAKLRIWSALFGETETKRSHEECQELLFLVLCYEFGHQLMMPFNIAM